MSRTSEQERWTRTSTRLRNRYLLLVDACLLPVAIWLAFTIRFESASWPDGASEVFIAFAAVGVPVKLALMWRAGLYSRLWRYASIDDYKHLALALGGAALASLVIGVSVIPLLRLSFSRVPLSVIALDALLGAVLIAIPRLTVRARLLNAKRGRPVNGKRVLIAGAGAAGAMIARELLENPQLGLIPIAFVDDDPSKLSRSMHGVEIVGALNTLVAVVQRESIDEVIIAMPSAPGKTVRDIVRAAAAAPVAVRTVPGLFELINGRKAVSALRRVEIADLLRREPVSAELGRVRERAHGRTILVTGAGGSIGSELCRQLATLEPATLIAVGRGENSIFDLLQDLRSLVPDRPVLPVIADVRDEARMREVFDRYRPHTVFHAAAHKHVPLMEENVAEAILNNVLGTQVVADLAWSYGAERFVLISSDKAVRPTSVMGATKRLAEGIVQRYEQDALRHFVSVRFGNVLGSRGSVVPIFLRQIQAGGPVTITDREMRRYFMTIPEAVHLVLQAWTMAEGSEVFVLDMGEPIRIYDLARDVIRLSGLEEGVDIEIKETGIRPGEKLYEELFFDAESATPTEHPKVLRAKHAAIDLGGPPSVDELIAMARSGRPDATLRAAIRSLVPDYAWSGSAGGPPSPTRPPIRPTDPMPRARPRPSVPGFAELQLGPTGDRV